jgi:hypothetical protein
MQVNGQTEIVQDPEIIAHAIQQGNNMHFSQANGSFFNQDKIRDIDNTNMIEYNLQLI